LLALAAPSAATVRSVSAESVPAF